MFTRKSIFRTFSILLVVLMMSGTVSARSLNAALGTGARLTYQGRLTNSSGAPLNSAVNMVFKLYDSTDVLLWTSATRSVTPVNGLFTVYLGDSADPELLNGTLTSVASIGVTVGSDPEMTPRQPLNSVVGHSDSGTGVTGSSNSNVGVGGFSNTSYGVAGYSKTGAGVVGFTGGLNGTGVAAIGAGPSSTALVIAGGNIRVAGAGIGENTPVFIQQVVTGGGGNICATRTFATVIDNPVINGNPGAILIVTPNYGLISGGVGVLGPYAVFYDDANVCGFGNDKWVIYLISGAALNNGALINVMAVLP